MLLRFWKRWRNAWSPSVLPIGTVSTSLSTKKCPAGGSMRLMIGARTNFSAGRQEDEAHMREHSRPCQGRQASTSVLLRKRQARAICTAVLQIILK